ncbi:hypothetical protein BK125_13670 [Paenibacillus odorifer]|jgi:GT2 family glycosyltransferase/ubiquinone/menaquinone biosynthesis C-methylase UbiE|uniref:Glycosyltransferase 2-like domain-containing protein n=1 Tax=Paenibacillus odorifer TaxID=189426 RepID=A0ABX3GEC0_9BACL|nr:bifunctional glycosyltransferase family 2 protein/class I SAM-dependent methyltransferase [Paenibacillus odorifer]OMC77570.1 hypothetical protein BK125_13670 [Paenibacillus odorifer]OMD06281.1 hypothetical protein BSO21_30930 [Paenibacillus odorifer]
MMTSIIILAYNQLEYTKMCIESIREYTDLNSYELIVIDNNSSDGTRDWLRIQSDIKLIENDSNLGFPKGCNQGIEISTGDNILLLNNDTIVTYNWLDNLLVALNGDPSVGAVSCVTNNCSYAQSVPYSYANIEEMHEFSKNFNTNNLGEYNERIKLIGFCYLIKKSVINEIGMLDEQFSPGNFEDDDFSLRIRKAGYRLLLCKDTFIHHFGSVSFIEEKEKYAKLLNRNAVLFEKKWGFSPLYSQHIRFDVLNMIQDSPDTELVILEVGCACGGTLLEVKNRYKNSTVFGIEINKEAAEVSSLIADVSTVNIEKEALPYQENTFDYIILADVLEHLVDPWSVLEKLRKSLKPSGRILISIPNIMHHSVIQGLLNGFWTYTDAGILDKTHMRFFTLYELKKMIISTGYKIDHLSGNSIGSSKDSEDFVRKLLTINDNDALKDQFNVYQYLISASKNKVFDLMDLFILDGEVNLTHWEKVDHFSVEEVIEIIVTKNWENEMKEEIFNQLGAKFFEEGKSAKAIAFLKNAYYLNSSNAEVLYNLTYALSMVGETSLAHSFLEKLKLSDEMLYKEFLKVLI